MYKFSILVVICFYSSVAVAGNKDSVNLYTFPDSVKPAMFISDVMVNSLNGNKKALAGIRNNEVSLFFETGKKRTVVFLIPKGSQIKASGLNVKTEKKERMSWNFDWNTGVSYKLLISSAADSAENFIIYSGYVFVPNEKKWKLIGTCKVAGHWNPMSSLNSFSSGNKNITSTSFTSVWAQRTNSKWYNLQRDSSAMPVVMPFPSVDSLQQSITDSLDIIKSVKSENIGSLQYKDGINYAMIKEGEGNKVNVTDTVTVFYKGYLLSDGTVFDQTKDKPAVFPLSRLIKGWQIGISETKPGGKVKLFLPSGLAYGIRTRGAKIPPNSVLIFEIEVVSAKPQGSQ